MKLDIDVLGSLRRAYAARRDPEGLRPLLDLYWRTMLVVVFLVVVLGIAYGMWNLENVFSDLGASVETPAVAPSAPFNRSKLDASVRGFDARQSQFDILKASAPEPLSDPSR